MDYGSLYASTLGPLTHWLADMTHSSDRIMLLYPAHLKLGLSPDSGIRAYFILPQMTQILIVRTTTFSILQIDKGYTKFNNTITSCVYGNGGKIWLFKSKILLSSLKLPRNNFRSSQKKLSFNFSLEIFEMHCQQSKKKFRLSHWGPLSFGVPLYLEKAIPQKGNTIK